MLAAVDKLRWDAHEGTERADETDEKKKKKPREAQEYSAWAPNKAVIGAWKFEPLGDLMNGTSDSEQ